MLSRASLRVASSIRQRSSIAESRLYTNKEKEQLFAPTYKGKEQAFVTHLYSSCRRHFLLENWDGKDAVIALRIGTDESDYLSYPDQDGTTLKSAALHLGTQALLKVSSYAVQQILEIIDPDAETIYLDPEYQIQVLKNMSDIYLVHRHQYAAFVVSENALLVWSDDATQIIKSAMTIENLLVSVVYDFSKADTSTRQYLLDHVGKLESGEPQKERSIQLIIPTIAMAAILLDGLFMAISVRKIVYASIRAQNYLILFALLYLPLQFFIGAFFCLVVVSIPVHIFGPIRQLEENSRFYSGVRPKRLTRNMPHITIQCPVYKESLYEVIRPTVESLKAAISTYEKQGGTATIFFNDDGMQLISEEERDLRKRFYRANDIGWVARPPAGNNGGFVRAGRFKKASNMNHGLDVSCLVSEKLSEKCALYGWDTTQRQEMYNIVLQETLRELQERTGFETWASGNIEIGEYVLLIDCDTRVPRDCFLDAANEFAESPDVAILQHTSGVMYVVNDFWENTIGHFTDSVNHAIRYATAAGDIAAFVGHNAFLRWSAIQEVAEVHDGRRIWWSETHVSEDFEMSLKLQAKGYIPRFVGYSDNEFKEGVSLTVYDELNRWSKYAYGCSELVFFPFIEWPRKGPFTPMFLRFVFGKVPGYTKFTILTYIGTYYALGLAMPLLILNLFISGWFKFEVHSAYTFYVENFDIFLSVIVVFQIAHPLTNAISAYRTQTDGFLRRLYRNFKYGLVLMIYFGGLSLHVSWALICHLFSIDLQWGSTAKTLESTNFSADFSKILKQYKWIYFIVFLLTILQIVLATCVPQPYRVWGVNTNLPLIWATGCHALAPLLFNHNSYLSELTFDFTGFVTMLCNTVKNLTAKVRSSRTEKLNTVNWEW